MDKDFKINLDGATLHVELDYELSTANAPALQKALEPYKGKDIQQIIFDATNLVFISSSGIRVIIFCTRELGKRPKIIFVNCAKEIYNSFVLTGIHNFITFVEDESKKRDQDVSDTDNPWIQKVAENKQKMLDQYAANNDVVMYQMKLGKND